VKGFGLTLDTMGGEDKLSLEAVGLLLMIETASFVSAGGLQQDAVPAQGVCTKGKLVLKLVSFWFTPVE
jgi:hypothetical protein